MKTFLAVYLGNPTSLRQAEWAKLDEASRQARAAKGMTAWGAWMTTHAASVVVAGGPLGKTKRVDGAGVADTKNNMSGFSVVRAESQEAAAHMFEGHPHFTIFPGDSVEIMEVLPIPGQAA